MVIYKKPLQFIIAALFSVMPIIANANPTVDSVATTTEQTAKENVSEEQKKVEERAEFIQHHLLDSHGFTLFSYGEKENEHHVGFPLPVILWDEGLHIFSSSEFKHDTAIVESKGKYFKIEHGIVYSCDKNGVVDHQAHTNPLKRPLDFSITKNVFMILVVGLLMFLLFGGLAKSYKKNNGIAKGVGRFFEPIVIFVRDEIAIPNIGEKHYKKYMSHLLSVFFFIWFLNMFGLTPLGVNVTGNIAITAALAIITYLITNISANKNYWGHIFWMPGVPPIMRIVLAPIELLGTIIKPFSLTIRLYANMVAGHIVLMSIIAMMYTFNNVAGSGFSFVLAFVLSILEILVAGLQAYIFTMLTALYFGSACEEHHHEEAHH
ncbi:ATP synthase F0 subcomplex A subunit [Flavobacterium croceum DSM 17960]|uniref:ATP synthase subunit a n=1 Tax=Flavobacterium croceum DSM 17960 TaxID=1121886 RepID=A0A2S4NB47_9FLAO|nr:F0F1 ATP synthase subunit A [Flavobacterium croceum]POS02922.1 ATP synthase F0 subcomplex A subunit [Flavobacterium croceum DSM 17960]